MTTEWIATFLKDHNYVYERSIDENEVWRNPIKIMVIHPTKGIRLIYRLEYFNEDYREDIIAEDLYSLDMIQASKVNKSPYK